MIQVNFVLFQKWDERSDIREEPAGMEAETAIQCTWQEVCDNFDDMNLREELLHGHDFEEPSAIQHRFIIPCVKARDVIAQAQSSKTATFSIAILQQINTAIHDCQALILAPTRELATQIQHVVMALGEYMKIHSYLCIGGTNVREDARNLEAGCHVVVGTPGRVYDMINRKVLRMNNIKLFMLAHEILSREFKDQIQNVFKMLPSDVQVIHLSAEMPPDVLKVSFIREPHQPASATKSKKSSTDKQKSNDSEYVKNHWVLEKQQVRVNDFRDRKLIDITEHLEKNEETLPQKKGTFPQWRELVAGKTATLSIAILQQINTAIHDCQALILAPTRELATQMQHVVMALGEYMKVHSYLCIGGTNVREDARNLEAGCHVVVGTPGRVYDMINRKVLRMNNIKLFMLAHEILSREFKDQIQNVFEMLPSDVQVIHLLAEMPPDVLKNQPASATKLKKLSTDKQKSNDSEDVKNNWVLEKQQVRVNDFRDRKLIDITEYFEKNEETLPQKKGTFPQWHELVAVANEICKSYSRVE